MSATGAAVPPAFQRLKPRTVRGARSSSGGAPSPWARRTVSTCTVAASTAPPPARLVAPRRRRRAHAEQALLQLAVGGELARPASRCAMRPLTITPMRSATSIATPRFCSISSTAISPSAGEVAQRLGDLLDDHRRQAFGRLVHHQQLRVRAAARGRSPASAARRRRAARRRCPCARPGAGTSRRRARRRAAAAPPGAGSRRPSATARRAGPAARRRCRAA